MPFSTATKNEMLDALTVDRVRLHSGDPGAAGTANALGSGVVAATFAAASSSSRALSSAVDFTGLGASASVTHFSAWDNNGGSPIFKGSGAVTGDANANAAGEYTLTTSTALTLSDS